MRRLVGRTAVVFGAIAVGLAMLAAVMVVSTGGGRHPVRPVAGVTTNVTVSPLSPSASPVPSAGSPTGAVTDVQQQRFAAAANLVRSRPGYLGIVVGDRQSGTVWRAGATGRLIWTSSTIKLAIATGVLERGRAGEITVDAAARRQITAMLTLSDNDAADALWNRYGKDALVPRFQQTYGMSGLTFVAGFPRYWGFMKCTPDDLHRLMSYILDKLDPADRDFLVGLMRHVDPTQRWGVWAAGPAQQPGGKDGWSTETDDGVEHWCTSTVGFAGPDERYVIAVMYHVPPGGTSDTGIRAVNEVVATVFGATVPDASPG